jgi:hypothetical protein
MSCIALDVNVRRITTAAQARVEFCLVAPRFGELNPRRLTTLKCLAGLLADVARQRAAAAASSAAP